MRAHELAGKLATVLRESQADKEKFVRTSMLRLQQQQMLLRSKLDRVYEGPSERCDLGRTVDH
jgi:hypothetical protein